MIPDSCSIQKQQKNQIFKWETEKREMRVEEKNTWN
jgi:hypothetical protein